MDTAAYLPKMKVRDSRLKPGMGWELTLEDGRLTGVRGQEYFIFENGTNTPILKPIPVEAPATGIMTILAGPDNKIWGATTLGQTIFWYNPDNGEYFNSQVVCDGGGEVYGMKFIGNKLYLAAYAGGDHMVYDITKPWNQIDNINPETLEPVRPKLIRPTGRSIQGPDGNFWTGWGAQYGVYGGGLSRIDATTNKMDYWYDPIDGWQQTIGSIEGDDKYIYFTTNGGASGLATKTEPFHLAAFDPFEGKVVKTIQFESGIKLGCLIVVNGYVAVSVDKQINIYKCGTLEFVGSINIDASCSCFVRYDDKRVAAFCNGKSYFITPEKLDAEFICDVEGTPRSAALLNGKLYFTVETKLFEISF